MCHWITFPQAGAGNNALPGWASGYSSAQYTAESPSAEGTVQCSSRDMRTPPQRHRGAGCAGWVPSRAPAHSSWPGVAAHGKHSCFPILLHARLLAPETVAIWCCCVHRAWVHTVCQERSPGVCLASGGHTTLQMAAPFVKEQSGGPQVPVQGMGTHH